MSGYIGVQPVPKATQRREYFTATNGQTSFSTSGYTPEYIDVYMNGVKLSPADFTATNGSDVVLGSGAATGDLLQIISFLPFSVLNQAFSGTLSVAGAVTANAGDVKVRSTSGSTLELTNTSTTLGDNAFVGGLAFRNDDTSGSPPHYAGIKARTDGSGGTEMDLEFYANRDKYETDAPHMILRSTGNLGINIADASQKLHVGGNAIITGLTRLGNGTESSPAYQFVDDTNTGMYRSSSDVLGFSTGGANRLTLNSTGAIFAGKIQIGNNLPMWSGAYGGGLFLKGNNATADRYAQLTIVDSNGTATTSGLKINNDGSATFGGNVGIGESVPLGKLHVKTADSGATADGSADELVIEGSGNAGMTILSGASSSGSIYFGDSGTNWDGYIAYSQANRKMTFGTAAGGGAVTIDSSGRVGIANDSPGDFSSAADDLVIGNSSQSSGITIRSGTTANGNIFFSDGTTGNEAYRGYVQYAHNGDILRLGTAAADRIVVDGSGAVTMPYQPAFSVHKNGTDQSNFALNTDVVVTWTHSRFDQNSDFDFVNGRFTAPVTGKYQLNANILLDNIDAAADYIIVFLATSNKNYRFIFDPDLDGDKAYWSVAISVLADMDANDNVSVKVNQGGGTQQTDIDGSSDYTTFSGYLVA